MNQPVDQALNESTPSPGEPTLDLLQRVRNGDTDAWESIHQRHRAALMRIARGSMRGDMRRRLDSEDLVQSTFLAALNGLDGFEHRGPGSLQAWLKMILVRRISEKLRHHMSEKRDVRRSVNSAALEAQFDLSTLSPSEAVMAAERHAQYIEALEALPELERQVIVSLHINRQTVGEVATELGVAESTVRRYRVRAIALMEKDVE